MRAIDGLDWEMGVFHANVSCTVAQADEESVFIRQNVLFLVSGKWMLLSITWGNPRLG